MYTPWQQLLEKYVDTLGRVDYQSWKAQDIPKLTDWLNELTNLNISTLEPQASLAFWLNLYNALTIKQILTLYPIPSVFPKIFGLPNPISFWTFFQKPLWTYSGYGYSLNRIEHQIIRKTFAEPRIHFALVCGAVGCPLLRHEAYTPAQVDEQLEDDAKRFINNPSKVYYNQEENYLYLSPIFRWYYQDFGSLLPYIKIYLNSPLNLTYPPQIRYLPYDWSLNQRISA
jgi:hypothetical protein